MKFTSVLGLALGFVASTTAQTAPGSSVAVATESATAVASFGPYSNGNSTSTVVGTAASSTVTTTKSTSTSSSSSESSASSTAATGAAHTMGVDRSVVGLLGLAVLGMAMA